MGLAKYGTLGLRFVFCANFYAKAFNIASELSTINSFDMFSSEQV